MQNLTRQRQYGTGALDDPRTPEEKDKDFRAEEIMAMGQVEWREKPESEWRRFPIFDQSSSGSCVAMTKAKELGVLNFLEEGHFMKLSPRDIYSRRANFPRAGMWGADANNIAIKHGATLESLMPSMGRSETEMNMQGDRERSFEVIAKVFRPSAWFALPFNIDAIANIILNKKRGVDVWFRFDMAEWDLPVPVINPNSTLSLHHAVCAVDATLYKGRKALVIEDSWGTRRGINGRRIITEDWISRMTWSSYFEDMDNWELLNDKQITLPRYVFTRNLKVGDRGVDVAQLQRCLGYLKDSTGYLFPLTQEPTGNFFGVTRRAVERFQRMKSLTVNGAVDAPTRIKLNKVFK